VVFVVAENHELTAQGAVKILGGARPFFVRLLEESKRPFDMVGSQCRVCLVDRPIENFRKNAWGESRRSTGNGLFC